jgi:hypothetical protein
MKLNQGIIKGFILNGYKGAIVKLNEKDYGDKNYAVHWNSYDVITNRINFTDIESDDESFIDNIGVIESIVEYYSTSYLATQTYNTPKKPTLKKQTRISHPIKKLPKKELKKDKYGSECILEIIDDNTVYLSEALRSVLNLGKNNIGFASDEDTYYLYVENDQEEGYKVDAKGIIEIPAYLLELKTSFGFDTNKLYVNPQAQTSSDEPGYNFFKITKDSYLNQHLPWNTVKSSYTYTVDKPSQVEPINEEEPEITFE